MISRTHLLIAAIVLGFLATTNAQAEPLTFSNVVALQNNSATQVDLFSNPNTVLFGPNITFLVDIAGVLPPAGTDTLQLTFTEAGRAPVVQTFTIPLFGSVPPPFTQVFSFTSLNANFQGTEASLKIDLLNSTPDFVIPSGPQMGQQVNSYTYDFKVAQPVPEPASIFLFGMGIAGVASRVRSRRLARSAAISILG
jgi:hypothetical protein